MLIFHEFTHQESRCWNHGILWKTFSCLSDLQRAENQGIGKPLADRDRLAMRPEEAYPTYMDHTRLIGFLVRSSETRMFPMQTGQVAVWLPRSTGVEIS